MWWSDEILAGMLAAISHVNQAIAFMTWQSGFDRGRLPKGNRR
jgi:hypothetical protein